MISVLAVDDDETLLDLGKRFLEKDRNFSVDCTVSARDALHRIATGKYDAVLSDYLMPEMDGISLLKKVRETDRKLPFIIFTGKGREEVAIEALNTGADYYIRKEGRAGEMYADVSQKICAAIRERRKDTAIQEREVMFRSFLEFLPLGIQACYPDGKVAFWNPESERIYGYTREEAIGRDLGSLIIPEEMQSVYREHLRVGGQFAESGEFIPAGELSLLRKDGSRVRVHSHHLAVCTPGKVPLLYCIDMDLSEREKSEKALAEVNRKLNMLSSITRHDILNQLMVLRTYLDITEDMTSDPLLLENLRKVIQAADSIEWQIEVARSYQDIGLQAAQWMNLADTIRSAGTQILGTPADVAVPPDIEVFADPLIEKVFFNLMDNSHRHGQQVTRMQFSSEVTKNGLVLVYVDDGIGIAPEDHPNLFQKGFGKNTGLGLFLSREILSITGITIEERGEPGKGVRFEIRVPRDHYHVTRNPAGSSDQK